jgi:putative FmdB family regulatory protein
MPIYEYGCPDCGHQFDALQKFSDDPITECPSCKANNVKKKISATSFVLKGSGWYKDHYGLKSGGDSAGSSTSSSSESSSSSTTSTPAPAASPSPSSTSSSTPAAPAAK